MDIIAHGVYNIALQKTLKRNKKTARQLLASFGWGILPDLATFGIPFLVAIFSSRTLAHHSLVAGFDLANMVYPYTHSLIVFGTFFFGLYFLQRRWYLPMLGWGFHILLDIPLHTPEFFPTPFLFPISTYTLPFGVNWGTPSIWITTWVIVLSWLGVMIFKDRSKHIN